MTITDVTVQPAITTDVDAALDEVLRRRERLWREPASMGRSARLAETYECEARLWSALFARARARVHWRAALAAEISARQWARYWRGRAGLSPARRVRPAGSSR